MRIDVLVTWSLLAVIAGVLYTAPKYILTKAKEGFNALTGKQVQEIRTMMETPSYSLMTESSKGVRDIPKDVNAGSTESTSASADTQKCMSLANGQGAILNEKKEKYQSPKPTIIYKTQTQYVPAPTKECPDLRDFIRKDQIPCWNCKLPA
jgi:hypothetical protein